jgi:hypothetical protein
MHEKANRAIDSDLVAFGLTVTTLTAMLWSVAMGRRVVGLPGPTEVIRTPPLPLGADIRGTFRQLDEMLVDRYGAALLPGRAGAPRQLAQALSPGAGIAISVTHSDVIDDRAGRSERAARTDPEPAGAGLLVSVAGLTGLLRRYLADLERIDRRRGAVPRARLLTGHRLDETRSGPERDGRVRVVVAGPATESTELGVPELILVDETDGPVAPWLGFTATAVLVDRADGRGPVPAQADWVAGPFDAGEPGLPRRRVAAEFDEDGDEYWVHQLASADVDRPDRGWALLQVPEFWWFDPVAAGTVPAGTAPDSAAYLAGYQRLLAGFASDRIPALLGRPCRPGHGGADRGGVAPSQPGPSGQPWLLPAVARAGARADVAGNAVVIGRALGSGPVPDGREAIVGLLGHAPRVLRYWQDRDAGAGPTAALRRLADGVLQDTRAAIDETCRAHPEAPQRHFRADCWEEIDQARAHRRLLAATVAASPLAAGPVTRGSVTPSPVTPGPLAAGPVAGPGVQVAEPAGTENVQMTGEVDPDRGVQMAEQVAGEPAGETLSLPPDDFLRRWAYDNPALADRRELLLAWLEDPTDREEVAEKAGLSLGALLRRFNETAPLSPPIGFRYRQTGFTVVGMAGVCDDVSGDRYPKFGSPVTVRCYYADPSVLPQAMFEAADWNFMDAGRPGFLGYGYGVRHGRTLYLAGLQSDLSVRYSYLFQGRTGATDVRTGDSVEQRPASELTQRYAPYVPVLRRTVQRYWIQIMLGAAAAWADAEPEVTEIGLLRFALEPEEAEHGNIVHRVYRDLPGRLGGISRVVRVGAHRHHYTVAPLSQVIDFLGDRWHRDQG